MGYGKKHERILKERNTNVKNIANQTGISPTLDNSEVVSITTAEGSDKKPHIAICLRD